MRDTVLTLTALARAGFAELDAVREAVAEYSALTGDEPADVVALFSGCADPDGALERMLALVRREPETLLPFLADPSAAVRLARVLGASQGLADFLLRVPQEVAALHTPVRRLPAPAELRADLLAAVGADPDAPVPVAVLREEAGWVALRRRYRRRLLHVASFDLEQADPVAGLDAVAACLADLAGAALEASLAVARAQLSAGGGGSFPPAEVAATRLAVIAMGKTGARELNYVSDVDVIFVAEGDEDAGLGSARAVEIATRLAVLTMRGADALALEPGLWQVDANLRPEGKAGALVRTLDSHLAYYDRWAKTWEFQALLKARPLAGDRGLGERYTAAIAPLVWRTSERDGFVESVQRMRERVLDNIAPADVDHELKLGPGGLRDIEFTVQLLQLVHGHGDPSVRSAATVEALRELVDGGYVGREAGALFTEDYRMLRLLEHRLQLSRLRRTHLMPRDEAQLRVLARASGLAATAAELVARWERIKRDVRGLHERLFYRPLLAAVAALPASGPSFGEERALTDEQARARLAAIGFADPRGALAHIAALTGGVSRAATIQRTLLPVLLQWLADGADPDYGLLTFRRLSEELGSSHWFLRLLRDSSGAAERLTRVLSGSRFVGELLGVLPEAVAWLDDEAELRPRPRAMLEEERDAVLARHDTAEAVAQAMMAARRREVLRLALGGILGVLTIDELGHGLSDIIDTVLQGVLAAVRRESADREPPGFRFAVIAMGRFGGRELGFGSDADVMHVYRADDSGPAAPLAVHIAGELARLTTDARLPLDLDLGLRPEGKNGPVARSLDAYAAYYARWSLTWEAQALLRARGAAGDPSLIAAFEQLADATRYPASFAPDAVREVRRVKARVESERLPQGADPARHLKLGRGSLSDVEWYVQLIQLQHAAAVPALRTTSTLGALAAAVDAGLAPEQDARRLRIAWILASRTRSALTLWNARTTDVLPLDRRQLDAVARLMEYPPHSATQLEQDYLAATRRARAVFERGFYAAV